MSSDLFCIIGILGVVLIAYLPDIIKAYRGRD